tara:strand:+ start:184 stop:501 length:318 start_codon:yes stop_codon:yes gene_type:complete
MPKLGTRNPDPDKRKKRKEKDKAILKEMKKLASRKREPKAGKLKIRSSKEITERERARNVLDEAREHSSFPDKKGKWKKGEAKPAVTRKIKDRNERLRLRGLKGY